MDNAVLEELKDLSTVEKAMELRRRHVCNCCQAVVAALADDPQLLNAASGFGGGMGSGQGPCGALIGAVICRELKGLGAGTVLCSCDDCVRNAVESYQEVMGE